MTNEEKHQIEQCRILIAGSDDFIGYIKGELKHLGFNRIQENSLTSDILTSNTTGIIIEYVGDLCSYSADIETNPIIFAFDFILGAGAIVLLPGDTKDWIKKQNIRVWAAEYMRGYCAFWNVAGCEWLSEAVPAIRANKTSKTALKTAAYICARIAANIAVGRNVKHYPRFYLAESGGMSTK